MSELINMALFDPIIPYIRCIEPGKNYLEIEVPHGLTIETGEVLKYFSTDVVFSCERGKNERICGSLKNAELFSYFITRYYELPPKF